MALFKQTLDSLEIHQHRGVANGAVSKAARRLAQSLCAHLNGEQYAPSRQKLAQQPSDHGDTRRRAVEQLDAETRSMLDELAGFF